MSIVNMTAAYETWLRQYMPIVEEDLKLKHDEMAKEPFSFFRATFYRWIQLWQRHCSELNLAPQVLGVGDLHVENFGTWRDSEGRLVWGVNDFDEAANVPYTMDLVRLAASAIVAIQYTESLTTFKERACENILRGYTETIGTALTNGISSIEPIVLAEENPWLLGIAMAQSKDPEEFWKKLLSETELNDEEVPDSIKQVVIGTFPQPVTMLKWRRRQAGLGSLGRPRYTAIAHWTGGNISREAKRICPSAMNWDSSTHNVSTIHYHEIIDRAIRCVDPQLRQSDDWIIRRLAPDCLRIRLVSMPADHEYGFLYAMGREVANVHIGTPESISAIVKHLNQLQDENLDWLYRSAMTMAAKTIDDFEDWKAHHATVEARAK